MAGTIGKEHALLVDDWQLVRMHSRRVIAIVSKSAVLSRKPIVAKVDEKEKGVEDLQRLRK